MDSAAPSPAASLREQATQAAFAAMKSRGWKFTDDDDEIVEDMTAVADAVLALPALREAAAPAQVDALAGIIENTAETWYSWCEKHPEVDSNVRAAFAGIARSAAALRARSASPAPENALTVAEIITQRSAGRDESLVQIAAISECAKRAHELGRSEAEIVSVVRQAVLFAKSDAPKTMKEQT